MHVGLLIMLRSLAVLLWLLVLPPLLTVPLATPARAAHLPNDPVLTEEIAVKEAVLRVHFFEETDETAHRAILDWIKQSARAVSLYYGRFPVKSVEISVVTFPGRGVRGGRAFGGKRPHLQIVAGTKSTEKDFRDDWRMVHEMIHLAFPMLENRHDWMTEGLAVYVESVARLQADHLDEQTVWKGFVDGMKKGLPEPGDKGLDFTPTWGRTYWGGALFCLVADLEIRKRTDGRRGLQDALRAVLAAGGNHSGHWPLRKALEAGDAGTGTTVLAELYDAWRATPVDPKLPELWKRLGVKDDGQTVSFDDNAALAPLRKDIGKPASH